MSVTAVAAAGEQFIPILGFREGTLRTLGIPQADVLIAYWTLLNERDGSIHGVHVVWEECETVYDIDRGVECYERLKAQGPRRAGIGLLESPRALPYQVYDSRAELAPHLLIFGLLPARSNMF